MQHNTTASHDVSPQLKKPREWFPPAFHVSPPARRLPVALADAFLDLALDQIALERAQIVDKQFAVQVICLVSNATRFQIHHVERERAAVDILRADDDALGA